MRQSSLLGSILLLLALPPASARAEPPVSGLYYGAGSTEASLSFASEVEFAHPKGAPDETATMAAIDEQIMYLYGTMQSAKQRAAVKDDYDIEDVQVAPKAGARDTYVAKYTFAGTALVENGTPPDHYDLVMPTDPFTVYERSRRTRLGSCTWGGHGTAGEFYYYWSPKQFGCPLKEGRDYRVVRAGIHRLENTRTTFPEYSRLLEADGTLKISILYGMAADEADHDPLKSSDENADNLRKMRKALSKAGYAAHRWTDDETSDFLGPRSKDWTLPFVETYEKRFARGKARIRLFFAPTSFDSGEAQAFHFFLKDTLENDSVLIYGGHSGYGANYDLAQIEKLYGIRIQPSLTRYQLYLFYSCSSYGAYSRSFFERKRTPRDPKGTRNLDVLTTGIVSYFSNIDDATLGLLDALQRYMDRKGATSYQDLVKRIDRGNLFGVNGDEDNPTAADPE